MRSERGEPCEKPVRFQPGAKRFEVRRPDLNLTRIFLMCISVALPGLSFCRAGNPGLADPPGATLCRASGAELSAIGRIKPRRGAQRVAGGESASPRSYGKQTRSPERAKERCRKIKMRVRFRARRRFVTLQSGTEVPHSKALRATCW